MRSSLTSDFAVISVLLLLGLLVLLTIRHYLPLRRTPVYLAVPIFLALFLPLSIVLLVPIDLASNRGGANSGSGVWLPAGVLLIVWRLSYWLIFALTWIILPLLGEYVDSGYRSAQDRLLYSIRSNARYQLILLLCAVAAGIYVFLVNGFRHGSVVSLVVALAYCWGLLLAIYLLGHGLVALPRRLFHNANLTRRLRNIQSQAPVVSQKLAAAKIELQDLEQHLLILQRRKNALSPSHASWIEELCVDIEPSSDAFGLDSTPPVLADGYLADLARKLNRARHRCIRFDGAMTNIVDSAIATEALIASLSNHQTSQLTSDKITNGRYFWQARVEPVLQRVLGIMLSLASICIVWSELVKYLFPQLSIINLTIVSHPFNPDLVRVTFFGQVSAALWLLYMCVAAISSFSDVKVWGNRALVRHETYPESAVWYSCQIAKLTVPLAYNFQTFLPPNVHRQTVFFKFLGKLINLTPLGAGFDYFFPIFILLPVCATLFDLYGRVRGFLGPDLMMTDDFAEDLSWQEGRDIIARLRIPTLNHGRLRERLAQHSTDETAARRMQAATERAEAEDENAFSGFAHRVQNTIEGFERPAWLQDLVTTRPKWATDDNTLSRWFGRPTDGRVRL